MSSLNITLFPNQVRIDYLNHLCNDHGYKESFFSFISPNGYKAPFDQCDSCKNYMGLIAKHLDFIQANLNSNAKWNRKVTQEKKQ